MKARNLLQKLKYDHGAIWAPFEKRITKGKKNVHVQKNCVIFLKVAFYDIYNTKSNMLG